LQTPTRLLKLKCINLREAPPDGGDNNMFALFILVAMIALVGYELVDEMRDSSKKLEDRYHE
jgi:hypothetical protein